MIEMEKLIEGARGLKEADLLLKNCRIVNVFTGEILEDNLAILGDRILGTGDYKAVREVDLEGAYLVPGLIDSHVHIESSLLSPTEFSKTLIGHGVTTVVADPHEIANVKGIEGIEYIMKDGQNSAIDVYIALPSCVPATDFESSGAVLDHRQLLELKNRGQVISLGEMMNYPGVLNSDREVLEKLASFKDLTIDGHGPGLRGRDLNAYIIAGVGTDHECSTEEEALEKVRKGMYVLIRQGSAAKDLKNLIGAVTKDNLSSFLFCTDDKHPRDLMKEGSVDHNIRLAIEEGIDPLDAIRMATINPKNCYGFKDIGAIGPGYKADLVVLESLEDFKIRSVYKNGEELVWDGVLLKDYRPLEPEGLTNTVNILGSDDYDFNIELEGDQANIIGINEAGLVTTRLYERVNVEDGIYVKTPGISKLAVIERHRATGNIGLGLLKNYNIENGAIGTTIGHDSHNLMLVGDNDQDMKLAAREIEKNQGGIVLVKEGRVLASLPLEIGGIISSGSIEKVTEQFDQLVELAFEELAVNRKIDPIMTLSFMALPVIPHLKMTDKGLFFVDEFRFLGIEEK